MFINPINNTYAGEPLFDIRLALGEPSFPSQIGWYDPPVTRFMSITNKTNTPMTIKYILPTNFTIDSQNSNCNNSLVPNESCQLAVVFNPNKQGHFKGTIQVCGQGGIWCSVDPIGFDVTVTNNDIISTQCNKIQSRPFATLDCLSSYTYAQNFYNFISRVLNTTEPASNQFFYYYQHTPSTDETTTPCLQARQSGVPLDPLIQGGGEPLCTLMGYATSNSAEDATTSKLFPPYLTMLLGTTYPILPHTTPLDELTTLLATFGRPAMDPSIQKLGYNGYVDFLNNYYIQQRATPYADCGTSAVCQSIYYLPYATNTTNLQIWPPDNINYWGSSGGGGSGAGYQIEAFRPGSTIHYTLFSGGGGGGGGNTTPEGLETPPTTLINAGSGGGGGSQFSDCYVTNQGNLNGLGLGAGTGSGISTIEGHEVTYQPPPATDYSYYPPVAHPSWNDNTILTTYGSNLSDLFTRLIPELYNNGYTITITGGGGGGAGLEFLNASGVEYQPHPVSIGYGFNFCYVFNKDQKHTSTDCISSPNAGSSRALFLDTLLYKNIGTFYNNGMTLAISACTGGYSNYQCTCSFQHAYVICELTNLLTANGFTSKDIPTWLINPHCNDNSSTLISHSSLIDQLATQTHNSPSHCATSIANFYQAKTSTICTPPWI